MKRYRFDAIVIGCGPAGSAAAVTMARSGLSVLVLEAGVYPGAENWSGCVYFAENMAQADIFGEEAVSKAPYERRLVRRGIFAHNGLETIGFSFQNPDTFRHCFTVLRPVYDPYWAKLARSHGAMILSETTVTSLIRKGGRVIGVETEHGPVFSEVVFIAEGDASHLIRYERLERVTDPHFMQGVKAVLNLPPSIIEERFRLSPGEGCANEYLIRNAQAGGQTLQLNIAAFLYTNRDSLSFGYVVPLGNLKHSYRGEHGRILEWLRGLPHFNSLLDGATLSAYGTKLIRTGGVKEQPILVENGLAIGGAATGLGIDLPYPNFTGPASASGMVFGRAVRSLLKDGREITAERLRQSYLEPLLSTVYGKNAAFLSDWPAYLDSSRVLFGRTTDIACGLSHFLVQSRSPLKQAARFLRPHLTVRSLRELLRDASRFLKASGLRTALQQNLSFGLIGRWMINMFKASPKPESGFSFSLEPITGRIIDIHSFPWPFRSILKRILPGLAEGMKIVYSNDGIPLSDKFGKAVRAILERLSGIELITIPAAGISLGILVAVSILRDVIQYYILRQPIDRLFTGPVSEYLQAQQVARDMDRTKTIDSFETKLATNTYRVGEESHIRVFWPDELARHGELAQSPIWSLCPARVYLYDLPPVGRGKVTINYENCIKCESCWHAADDQVLWGRFTDHRLIYRPNTAAFPDLFDSGESVPIPNPPRELPDSRAAAMLESPNQTMSGEFLLPLISAADAARRALRGLETAIRNLPPSPDPTRRDWPRRIGSMALKRLARLQSEMAKETTIGSLSRLGVSPDLLLEFGQVLDEDQKDLEHNLSIGQEFRLLSSARRIREGILDDILNLLRPAVEKELYDLERIISVKRENQYRHSPDSGAGLRISTLFPDQIVKEWEYKPVPSEAKDRLRTFISEWPDDISSLIYHFSIVSPALGLLAARHLLSLKIQRKTDTSPRSDLCAVTGQGLAMQIDREGAVLNGKLELVPLNLSNGLLILHQNKAWSISLDQNGVRHIPTPGIGFRAAGLHRVEFKDVRLTAPVASYDDSDLEFGKNYIAIALGAADYLARRTEEHAEGRVQFDQQMLDTEGRNGIDKLGAVKAMIARIEAWRLLLAVSLEESAKHHRSDGSANWELYSSVIAPMAFGPSQGQIGYDAGQVFGGFAYSEDDLLSRSYRDSALFRFLEPGRAAGEKFMTFLQAYDLELDAFNPGDRSAWDEAQTGPLSESTLHWAQCALSWKLKASESDAGKAGEAGAVLIGVRQVLLYVQDRLEAGFSVEAEAAAALVLLDMAERAIDTMEAWPSRVSNLPVLAFPEKPTGKRLELSITYQEICEPQSGPSPRPYRSGQYLTDAFDSSPRFVPEIQLHDPDLRGRWEDCTRWFIENFWTKSFDGLHLERYVEKIHGIPEGVLAGFKANGYFSTVIPADLDGGGWWKAEYYILTTAAGRFGDAGLLLVIMANTSIGTTPILLGLEKELPLAVQELEPLSRDPNQLGEIARGLDLLIGSLKRPDPARLKKSFSDLMSLVESRIRRTRVVKYLSANFLKAFYAAAIAGRRRDLDGFRRGLVEAKVLFEQLPTTIRQAADELPRRERAHRIFLRMLAHGGISAFALTEPTAGSDTGGVKTSARPVTRAVTPLEDGRFEFEITSSGSGHTASRRYLIDSDRIRFDPRPGTPGMFYEPIEGSTVSIEYDEYRYDTDEGLRYYIWREEKRYFHDIGQIRFRDGKPYYDYYELTGAKMWITNGRVATQFCLYAQSPEGVTGFMLDRHSEGLKVGADERKMGQRGSPTNEISIDQVRIPKECIIGYEGHGQVNALETLNVGRCGLAVASITLMRKLLLEAAEQIPPSDRRNTLLGEASAILFGADSAAFYLVGLVDRPATESVRMESAIAKYLCSEDLHELICLIEEAYGPSGSTEEFRVEKIRRDSRILNIYEGTNEVQRFLILKDLVGLVAHWNPIPESTGLKARLSTWKETLRTHVKTASDLLGDAVWMDAVLQPTFFALADMAGEIFRMDALLYRMQWLGENRERLGKEYTEPHLMLANRSMERCEQRLAALDRNYRRGWLRTQKGMYAPESAAADAALSRQGHRDDVRNSDPTGRLSRTLRILCLLRPMADLPSTPRLKEGRLSEMVWRINPSDESAARLALSLKKQNPANVLVHLLIPGGPESDHLIRRALGLGADGAFRIESSAWAGASAFAEAVAKLETAGQYDMILSGSKSEDGSGPLGPAIAGHLSREFMKAVSLEPLDNGKEIGVRTRTDEVEWVKLPKRSVVIGWETAEIASSYEINALIHGQLIPIETVAVQNIGLPEQLIPARPIIRTAQSIRDLSGVVNYLKDVVADVRPTDNEPYRSKINEAEMPSGPAVWTLLESHRPKVIPTLMRAAHFLGQSMGLESFALVLGPEISWPGLAGLAYVSGLTGAVCFSIPEGPMTESGRIRLLENMVRRSPEIRLLADSEWADSLAYFSGGHNGRKSYLFTDITEIDRREGLCLFKKVYDGKLRRSISLGDSNSPIVHLTVLPTAEIPAGGPSSRFTARSINPRSLSFNSSWMGAVVPEPLEDLSAAELIIDVGYGVRNQEGFGLVLGLKEVLERLGARVHLGATRKVTQDLKLLPLAHQIGQTGVRVNPKVILALGISGAPQHMDYIGDRAVIFSFNKDSDAPLMRLNETRPSPIVHPIVGDLFETVPKLIEMLSE